ncbi:diguanylate cyclase [Brumicola blandensis]|uniref:diguanylate cyclase n=1 Tax=Brumicola blandensis TaxID=3075611 RepID=A0AAW8R2A1_9ALTE|nr:diguanylate cyclase [Alteromonas sp. W409]MDT0582442.1 diguanylate cyclase [Alteromonas sp. W409]
MIEEKATILVVDDEAMNIQIINNALSKDYHILAAISGEEALRVARRTKPDLILLDIVLPDISGHEVCRALKNDIETKHIPIIFVTSQNRTEDELKGLELGAVDYFRKPFVVPLLQVRVRNQIDLVVKTRALEKMAWVDGLTGISNRRHFDKKYEDACKYAQRNKRSICLLLIDIDYFKQYNDHYGHAKGDLVLREVAHELEAGAARPLDLVARYGGEEFVILLTDSSETEGALVAEKVREQIEMLAIPHEKSLIHQVVTVSIGVTTSPADGVKFDHDMLLNTADECLYEAKASGRNTIVSTDFRPTVTKE